MARVGIDPSAAALCGARIGSGSRRPAIIAAFWRRLDSLGRRRKLRQNPSETGLDFLGLPWFFSSKMSVFNWLRRGVARKIFLAGDPSASARSAIVPPEKLSGSLLRCPMLAALLRKNGIIHAIS